MARSARSRRFRRSLKLSHIVVQNGLLTTTTVPLDRYTGPIRFGDGALVGIVLLPADFVADFEVSGLFAGHFLAS